MTPNGAILFCVCRGKVSEGLDFTDKLCRGVIFVGVPYPNISDPIMKEKRTYLDKIHQLEKQANAPIPSITGD